MVLHTNSNPYFWNVMHHLFFSLSNIFTHVFWCSFLWITHIQQLNKGIPWSYPCVSCEATKGITRLYSLLSWWKCMHAYIHICTFEICTYVSSICIDGAPNEKANESSVCELFRLVPLRGICMNVKVWSSYMRNTSRTNFIHIYLYSRRMASL